MDRSAHDRRLAAIVAADIAEYSRLMGRNEERTVQMLRAYRAEIVEPLLEIHGGRIANTAGDSLLVEFPSAVEAVRCSLELQDEIRRRNQGVPEDEQLVFRIGINVGDVIAEGRDLLGDGVNVAARLEGVSDPGGVVVSRSARDQVRDRLDIDFEDLGEIELKNIARPVRAFRISRGRAAADVPGIGPGNAALPDPIPAAGLPGRHERKSRVPACVGGLLAVIVAAMFAVWRIVEPFTPDDRAEQRDALSPTDRPSLAVLPFHNPAGNPEQAYFADGMAEDLITDLSKVSSLLVISRNSSFTFKGRNATVEEVANALGVRFVLEGSVRYSGQILRVNAQLVDTVTGGTIWAERYDRDRQGVFQMQDEITTSIVHALKKTLLPGELEKLQTADTVSVAAHDAYLRGLALYRRSDPVSNASAAEAFRRSLKLDPEYGRAKSALAKAYVQAGIGPQAYAAAMNIHWSEGLAQAWALLDQTAGPPDAGRHVIRSWLALRKHQHRQAITEARRALELEPNETDAMEALAEALIYAGQVEAGLEEARRALRQNPGSPARARFLLGLAHYAQNQMEQAATEIETAIDAAPSRRAEFSGLLAAALARQGRTADAAAAFEIFTKGYLERPSKSWTVKPEAFQNPRFHTWRNIDLAWAVFNHPFQDPTVQERLAEDLTRAGAAAGHGGFLSLHRGNRLLSPEISELLLNADITGSDFWLAEREWLQFRDGQGSVRHTGFSIHAGPPSSPQGTWDVRDNLLCEKWSLKKTRVEICVAVFRLFDERARRRWGDFVMVTDVGPFPFSVIN